jgi:hypothetical protein
VFKGRFAVATTLTGNGINLSDLVGRMEHEYRLTSKNGIVRLLKTSVAETIPEPIGPGFGRTGLRGLRGGVDLWHQTK